MGKECCSSGSCDKKHEEEPNPSCCVSGKKQCCSQSQPSCVSNNEEEPSCCDSGKCSKSKESCSAGKKEEESCCGGKQMCSKDEGHDHHHRHHHETREADPPLCLAVVREDGADVVIFDASGVPRTFSYKGKGDIRKLCFQTHGFDDLLTSCFDEEGNHGSPEESCFCGVDTPHLHAHLRDPATCDTADNVKDEAKIGYLASQILHPSEEESLEDPPVLHMNITESMPKQCNYEEVARASSTGSDAIQLKKGTKRLHKVQHDDHVDYLMHNAETGQLHLEHPCDSCGRDDVHGRFKAVGKRRLRKSGSDIQMQFFEVAARPFNVLDCLTDLFEISSDRVSAVENILPHDRYQPPKVIAQQPAVVRSTLTCAQICCAAEIPAINTVLEPINGVEKVMINVPLKQIIVDHDARVVSVTEIAGHLNRHKLGANVLYDGGAQIQAAAATGRSQFHVGGICCASEIPAINSILEPLPGVKNVSINTTTKTVYVDHEPGILSAQQICDALNAEHFGAEVRVDAAETLQIASRSAFVMSTLFISNDATDSDTETLTTFLQTFVDASQMEKFVVDFPTKTITVVHNPFCLTAQRIAGLLSERTQLEATVSTDGADPAVWKFPETLRDAADNDKIEGTDMDEKMTYPRPTVLISGLLWVISMLSLIGGKWEHLKWVALVSVAFGIPPIAMKAFRTLRRYQFDTNCLMFFAAVGALALQDFTEAAAVVFLFALSEWLEVRATSRARHALATIVQLRPDKAHLVHPTTLELLEVPASLVPVGALVSVKTGDKIPCDGVVAEGHSTVDESSLTGESRPIRKGPKDKVSGGTVNSGLCPLMVRTTASAENSAVSRLIRLVEEAQANRSETEKLVDEFAKVYTPVVVLAALLMCSIPWAFGKESGREWTHNGLILVVVACPCALIISTPVSYVAGLAAAAQKGILIKGGASLEALGAVKHVCFDKTGTLTNGEFALLHMKVLADGLTRNEVFQFLCLMEERASHPVAQAILTAANNENVVLPKKMVLQKHTIINGEGVAGVIDGLEVHVGNDRLFARLGLLDGLSEIDRQLVESWKVLGGTVGYMSIEGHGIVCAYCAADGIRSESAAVVANLKKLGIKTTMLTGDNDDAAQAIGRQVGLCPEDIKSKLLPEDKLQYVENLSEGSLDSSVICNPCKRKRLTLMCGDGVNDAPALAVADVGVAMGEGAALSMETSDVTLLDSNLEKLEYSINIGKRVTWKIIENVIFSLVVKFLVLGFALSGRTELWAAIASDVGAMLVVTLNAMLLLPKRQTRAEVDNMKGDIEEAMGSRTTRGLARQSSVKTDSCSDEAATTKRLPNEKAISPCAKNCCGSDVAMKPVSVPEDKKKCTKGCCGSKDTSGSDKASITKHSLNKSSVKACAIDCCGPDFAKKAASASKDKEQCEKSCCASQEETNSSHDCPSHNSDAKM